MQLAESLAELPYLTLGHVTLDWFLKLLFIYFLNEKNHYSLKIPFISVKKRLFEI